MLVYHFHRDFHRDKITLFFNILMMSLDCPSEGSFLLGWSNWYG
jgi:hypothetical protein